MDLPIRMGPRDGAGLCALFEMLLVTYHLHLDHGFLDDSLKPASDMVSSLPRRERVVISPSLGCS